MLKDSRKAICLCSYLILLLLTSQFTVGQSNFMALLNQYEEYNSFPREIAYLHLNKSVFIKGEQLAFAAYLWDRTNDRPATESRNLYVQLRSGNNKVLKQQLILLTDGVGNGLFEVDSLLQVPKQLKIVAFTNYMRNFKEPNHFEAPILVIDREVQEETQAVTAESISIEMRPEGGNYLAEHKAKFGIKASDGNGAPLRNREVTIKDSQGNDANTVRLDEFGESQFILTPGKNTKYTAHLEKGGSYPFPAATGDNPFSLELFPLGDKIALQLKTAALLESQMFLAIHNGQAVKTVDVNFFDGAATVVLPKPDLYQGMNVFTLIDAEGRAWVERHYYNFEFSKSNAAIVASAKRISEDSVKIRVHNLGSHDNWNHLSAGALPENTKSYLPHHNIVSYTELFPYTRGGLVQPGRYFKTPTPKLAYALNNALISLNHPFFWEQALQFRPKLSFPMEDGLTLIGKPNNEAKYFVLNGSFYGDAQTGIVEDGSDTFRISGVYPLVNEKMVISEVAKNGKFKRPGIFVRFEPAAVPRYQLPSTTTPAISIPKEMEPATLATKDFEASTLVKVTQLDEVEVVAKREEERKARIRSRNIGRVDFFTDNDPRRNRTLSVYLNQYGFTMTEFGGRVGITNRIPNNPFNAVPAVYLDGFLLLDLDVLLGFTMYLVDYIVINRAGTGGGPLGGGGVIKIFTDPSKLAALRSKTIDFGYTASIGFTAPKTYRRPEYYTYSGDFFSNFGVLGWFPKLKLNTTDTLEFTVWCPELDAIKLVLEGVVDHNQLISKELVLTVEAP